MAEIPIVPAAGDRLAKIIARAGLCSRRDAELWIKDGRVAVNGKTVKTPAFNVTEKDQIKVDGEPLAARQGTRVWLYHKPAGLVVTEKDPEGRETIFEKLEEHGLPRVVTIGRLDINTEGLLLLTNDGGLKRVLELPATGWLRKYRVRAFGTVTQPQLDRLKDGTEIDGVKYGPIEATLEREQGANTWLLVALREGKNREVKNVLAALGLQVNRLIRVSFGPFQLGDIPVGGVETVKARILRDQLGKRLADEAGADFESDLPEEAAVKRRVANPKLRAAPPGREAPQQRASVAANIARFRFTDRADKSPRDLSPEERPRQDRPGRYDTGPARRPRREEPEAGPPRKIHFADGREAEFKEKTYGKKTRDDKPGAKGAPGARPGREDTGRPARSFGDKPRPPRAFEDRPRREGADRPRPPRADGDRPRSARPDGDRPRPPRAFDNKPRSASDRPKRDFGDRPKRDFGDKPRPAFGDKPRGARPPRRDGDAPRPPRAADRKPYAPRAHTGAAAPDRKPRLRADGKPFPKRDGAGPRGPRPGGDKPRGPRKPRP